MTNKDFAIFKPGLVLYNATPELNKWVVENDLRIRLFQYKLSCCGRSDCAGNQLEFPKFGVYSPYHYFEENNDEILDLLRDSMFIRYSTIIIVVNRFHDKNLPERGVDTLLRAVKSNESLRYKPIILLNPYRFETNRIPWKRDVINLMCYEIESMRRMRPKKDYLIYPKDIAPAVCANVTTDYTLQAVTDYEDFESVILPNATMVQIITNSSKDSMSLETLLNRIYRNGSISVQETLSSDLYDRCLVYTMKNAYYYFYAINPALAIIINNYHFTTIKDNRRGSDIDVCHIIRLLKCLYIPHILVQDCNRQELKQIVEYMESKDFSPIKLFMLFLMSHGKEGDVLRTRDGQVNIREVVSRLAANPSLKDAEKLVLVNACRGDIDLDLQDYREIENTQSLIEDMRQTLVTKTTVMYGVPNGVQSIRLPDLGSPFIRLLCHHLANMSATDDIRSLEGKINQDLSRIDYYDGLNKCSDLLESDSTQRHAIVSEPIPAVNMVQLLRSIQRDFPLRELTCNVTLPSRYLFICGALKLDDSDEFRQKYFDKELEEDDCKVEAPFKF